MGRKLHKKDMQRKSCAVQWNFRCLERERGEMSVFPLAPPLKLVRIIVCCRSEWCNAKSFKKKILGFSEYYEAATQDKKLFFFIVFFFEKPR